MITGERVKSFIAEQTRILPVPLVPEISLHLAHEAIPLWQKTEEELEAEGLAPPFWAFAWAGGQALARHIFDNSHLVRGRTVLDLATGSGLVAIAAAKAGASRVLASDVDVFAGTACALNAALNRVDVDFTNANLLETVPAGHDVILCGDLFYDRMVAGAATRWLKEAQQAGCDVVIGDPGRSYLPFDDLERLASYAVPVSRDLEDSEIKNTSVWRFSG